MCYAKPGPRCSKHATENLKKALSSGDTNRIRKAKEEYLLSPAGIEKVLTEGKIQYAQELVDQRKSLIQQSKEQAEVMKYIKDEVEQDFGHLTPYSGRNYVKETIDLINSYKKQYGFPLVGRTRAVFDRGDGYVLKVPFSNEGYMASDMESRAAEDRDSYIPVAHCFYDETRADADVPVLIMEKVIYDKTPWDKQPAWVGSVDGAQVGWNKDGKLVAYDL